MMVVAPCGSALVTQGITAASTRAASRRAPELKGRQASPAQAFESASRSQVAVSLRAAGWPPTFSMSSMIHAIHLPNSNRLYLVNAPDRESQAVYELLSGMEFYTPDPESMRLDLDTRSHS